MTKQTRSGFKASKNTLLEDNTSEDITPKDVRDVQENIADSAGFLDDDNTWEENNNFTGHFRRGVKRSSSTAETLGTETFYIVTAGSSATLTMPSAMQTGKEYRIKNDSAYNVTIQKNGSNEDLFTSSAVSSFTILPYSSINIIGDGTYWNVESAYYEAGTFTPGVEDSSSNAATGTFTGQYTKIGDLVYLNMELTDIDTTGMTGGDVLRINNLPFNVGTGNPMAVVRTNLIDWPSGTNGQVIAVSFSDRFQLQQIIDNGSASNITVADISSGSGDLTIFVVYKA
ncbi:MAG: hypothetical protein NXI20_17865 [bacterium]|nr:hypothetical protein [bacterium]